MNFFVKETIHWYENGGEPQTIQGIIGGNANYELKKVNWNERKGALFYIKKKPYTKVKTSSIKRA